MRSKLLPLAFAFVFAPVARADDAEDAKAIVEKAIKAVGYKPGEKINGMTWKETGKYTGGGLEANFTADFAFQAPGKFRYKIAGDLNGMKVTFEMAANGTKAWESGFGSPAQDLADE